MSKLELERRIVDVCLGRYNGNLAAVLLFGSYNTGHFREGISDIDSIILFKETDNVDFKSEPEKLRKELSDVKLSIQHFHTLKDYFDYIQDKGSWASWITVVNGSKVIYKTREFEEFKERLQNNPISKEKLAKYLKQKDKFELDGYFKERREWDLTKAIFAHIRRKLQVMNYLAGNSPEFDYDTCLTNLNGEVRDKDRLVNLGEAYEKRRALSEDEVKEYVGYAKKLTGKLVKELK